jgi:hypothetical protein
MQPKLVQFWVQSCSSAVHGQSRKSKLQSKDPSFLPPPWTCTHFFSLWHHNDQQQSIIQHGQQPTSHCMPHRIPQTNSLIYCTVSCKQPKPQQPQLLNSKICNPYVVTIKTNNDHKDVLCFISNLAAVKVATITSNYLLVSAHNQPEQAWGIEFDSCYDFERTQLHCNGCGLLMHKLCLLIHQFCLVWFGLSLGPSLSWTGMSLWQVGSNLATRLGWNGRRLWHGYVHSTSNEYVEKNDYCGQIVARRCCLLAALISLVLKASKFSLELLVCFCRLESLV